MEYVVSAQDRAAFKRCRRQWDFTATARRRLVPVAPQGPDIDLAMREALAVYYFPGMWDWDSAIVLPLVAKGLDESFARQRATSAAAGGDSDATVWGSAQEQAHALLERYFTWAPTVDRFSPVRVSTDFDALVPDPEDPDRGLMGPDGAAVHYTGRIDLLAIDEHDRYWVVRHLVVRDQLPSTQQLVLDEESVAACWAWGRFYDGMDVAGTIYNELTLSGPGVASTSGAAAWGDHPRGGIPQNEPSGGGRGVSSLRRMYVKSQDEEAVEPIRQTAGDGFRRTVIRRSPRVLDDAGRRLAEEAIDMVREDVSTYPNPRPENCAACAFVPPCLAANDQADVERVLTENYRPRPATELEIGRLGGSPYGVGRGWVPPPRRR